MPKQIDVNDIVNGLLQRIAEISQENALLKVQLDLALREEVEENGNESVPAGNSNE